MHAALVKVTIDPTLAESASDHLTTVVLPMVKAAPGFVAGYWLEPVDGKAESMVFFETEAQARQTVPPAGSTPTAGVKVDSVEIRAVAVNI